MSWTWRSGWGGHAAGAENLTSVTIGRDHLTAVVSTAHPYAGRPSVSVAQLRQQHLIVASCDDEPAIGIALSALLGEDSAACHGATVARDVHTIISLAVSGVGVGLGPSRMTAVPRKGAWFCRVTPPARLPDLVLSFATQDRSPCWPRSSTPSARTARRSVPRSTTGCGRKRGGVRSAGP